MELIAWKEEYSIGNKELDDQHKKIIEIIRELHSIAEKGDDKEAIQSILNELADYTSYHFTAEEEFMEQIGYPKLEEHKSEHAYYSDEVFEGLTQFSERGGIEANNLLDFLNNWWKNHIMDEDLNYINYSRKSE